MGVDAVGARGAGMLAACPTRVWLLGGEVEAGRASWQLAPRFGDFADH